MKAQNSVMSKMKESKTKNYQHYFQKYSTNVKTIWHEMKSFVTILTNSKSSPND